jgi:hypothetical protein
MMDGLELGVQGCFAFDDVTKAGIAQQYLCGIMPRLTGWVEGLSLAYEISPEPTACLMAQGLKCRYAFRLKFGEGSGTDRD